VRRPFHRNALEIFEGQVGSSRKNLPRSGQPTQGGKHFEIDQFGRHETFTAKSRADGVAVRAVIDQRHQEHAGVNDDHGRTA